MDGHFCSTDLGLPAGHHGHRQGLSRECGLVNINVPRDTGTIRRDRRSRVQGHDVRWDEVLGVDVLPFAVALHLRSAQDEREGVSES